jgi:hypothetical protein
MKRLFRILHWRAQARYWRRRYVRAAERADELASRLTAEAYRNREREDMFVSASVFGARGMFGIAPRGGPAGATQPTISALPPTDGLSGIDRMEYETIWLPDAIRNNVDPRVAKASFMAELAQRRAHPDVM